MKILIIDNEAKILHTLKRQMSKVYDDIRIVDNYLEGISEAMREIYDVIICDYSLDSNKTGIELIQEIRNRKILTPAILLTGKSLETIKPEEALSAGLDDFLTKPYRLEELVARIKALIRRSYLKQNEKKDLIIHRDIGINLNNKSIIVDNNEIKVGKIMFRILHKLIRAPGKIVSYDDFIEYIWGESARYQEQSGNALRVHISNLKKLLGKHGKHIKNMYGYGYTISYDE